MAKKSLDPYEFNEPAQDGNEKADGTHLSITPEVADAFSYVINEKEKAKLQSEAIKEAVAAIAAKMGIKPAQVNGIISRVVKEREKGGVITEEEQTLDLSKELLEKMGDEPSGPDSNDQ